MTYATWTTLEAGRMGRERRKLRRNRNGHTFMAVLFLIALASPFAVALVALAGGR